ncbi:MAG: flagellar hook-associated protein FlgL [Desulfatiglandaceae bacterium]
MRVSNQSTYDAIKYQLSRTAAELVKANEVVSSGKRINKLSDDPIGMVQVLSLRESLANIDQLGRNISTGNTWLDAGETALGSVKGLITDMKTLSIQMANGTVGADERKAAAAQVEGTLEQIVSLANTQANGQYIFAGTKTDTKPFEIQRDLNGNPTGVTYSGNDTPFSIKIGKNTNIEVGHDGEAVFQGGVSGGIFQTLIEFKNSLETDSGTGIGQAMTDLDNDLNHMISKVSDIGTKGVRLDVKEKILEDLKLSYTENKSKLEDADILAAISDVQSKETAYQAALASSAKVMKMSLIDYL